MSIEKPNRTASIFHWDDYNMRFCIEKDDVLRGTCFTLIYYGEEKERIKLKENIKKMINFLVNNREQLIILTNKYSNSSYDLYRGDFEINTSFFERIPNSNVIVLKGQVLENFTDKMVTSRKIQENYYNLHNILERAIEKVTL